jgi:hypothetical protein
LVAEKVRTGFRNARAKRKKQGGPKSDVGKPEILHMRGAGASWRAIIRNLGLSANAAYYAARKAV